MRQKISFKQIKLNFAQKKRIYVGHITTITIITVATFIPRRAAVTILASQAQTGNEWESYLIFAEESGKRASGGLKVLSREKLATEREGALMVN